MGQPQRIFDNLLYVNQLKGAGFTETQATVHAETLYTILDNQLLTKQDMHDMEMRLNGDMTRLSSDIQKLDFKITEVETRLSSEIKGVDSRLTAEIKGVETRLSGDIQKLDFKITEVETRLSSEIKRETNHEKNCSLSRYL